MSGNGYLCLEKAIHVQTRPTGTIGWAKKHLTFLFCAAPGMTREKISMYTVGRKEKHTPKVSAVTRKLFGLQYPNFQDFITTQLQICDINIILLELLVLARQVNKDRNRKIQ